MSDGELENSGQDPSDATSAENKPKILSEKRCDEKNPTDDNLGGIRKNTGF